MSHLYRVHYRKNGLPEPVYQLNFEYGEYLPTISLEELADKIGIVKTIADHLYEKEKREDVLFHVQDVFYIGYATGSESRSLKLSELSRIGTVGKGSYPNESVWEESVTTVIIADAHAESLERTKRCMQRMEGYKVIGQASDADLLFTLVEKRKPQLLIVDCFQPGFEGERFLARYQRKFPWIPLLVHSKHINRLPVHAYKRYSVKGSLRKTFDEEALSKALKKLQKGKFYFPEGSMMEKKHHLRKGLEKK